MNQAVEISSVPSAQLLAGVNVIELSHHVAGAYCGKVLAQLGACVSRFGPETDVVGSSRTRKTMQRVFHGRKLALPSNGPALQIALSQADIVIAERGGLEEEFAQLVDDVIARRMSLRDDATLMVLSAAAEADGEVPGCGLTSAAWAAMSWAIGEPSREPLAPPYDIADHEAGISAAAAALVGLLCGFGIAKGAVEVSTRDVLAHFVGILVQNYLPYGRPWRRDGRRPFMSGGIYPLGLFTCKDGHVALYCRNEREWQGILNAMGNPSWSKDERFRDPRLIARHHAEEADLYLLPWLKQHSRAELAKMGLDLGFPAAPVRFMGEVLSDPQFAFRGSLESLDAADASVMVPTESWRLYERQADANVAGAAATATKPWPLQASGSREPSRFFEGLRVLDLSWVWSGPMVTSVLADFGAEVIKIEHPSRLDSVRLRGRPLRDGKEMDGPTTELNPWFNQLNHAKRSVVLDIKSEEGQEEIRKLAATCDVVVENMRPGALDKVMLGYTDLVRVNPSIVMLSMTLPGQTGPLRHMKGYAGIMTSMAGLESLVGYAEPDGAQTVVGMAKTALGDPNGATHAVTVLMAALYRRKMTGRGLWIDLAQTDAILSILAGPLVESQLSGQAPVVANQHPLYAPHGHFACNGENKWIALSVQTERQWQQFVHSAEAAELAPFAQLDLKARLARRREVERAVGVWTSRQTPDEVVATLTAAGVPAAPVASYQEMSTAMWRRERALTRVVDHPYIGKQEVVVPPWHFGSQTAGVERPAPLLGADTDDVLAALSGGTVKKAAHAG